ncbi:MAG: hypothetical protein RL364_687, partial [Pseudomonadota bacterium]
MTKNLSIEDLPSGATTSVWTISDVERETGLGKDTLRVWERRYGFPQPLRTGTSERLYTHEQLQKLQLIKRLLDAGERPGKVVALDVQTLQSLLSEKSSQPLKASKKGQGKSAGQAAAVIDLEEPWVQWLADDETLQIKQALQQKILRRGL